MELLNSIKHLDGITIIDTDDAAINDSCQQCLRGESQDYESQPTNGSGVKH